MSRRTTPGSVVIAALEKRKAQIKSELAEVADALAVLKHEGGFDSPACDDAARELAVLGFLADQPSHCASLHSIADGSASSAATTCRLLLRLKAHHRVALLADGRTWMLLGQGLSSET